MDVGDMIAACEPLLTIIAAANAATTVLPEPTSPWSRRFIGLPESRSARISLIALCWTDKEGNPLSAVQLVNNLDLMVTDPASTVYLGNVFAAEQSNTGGSADNRTVEECVRRNVPAAGSWKVRVTAANLETAKVEMTGHVIGANEAPIQKDRSFEFAAITPGT